LRLQIALVSGPARIEALARRHPGQVRIVDAKKSYVPLGEEPVKTPEIVERLRALLRT
jgi:transcription-repair coupling factor (superfamily II helicase)